MRKPVACLLSGNGTTMSALLFQSRLPDCPYEIVLVASNSPDAPGLKIAAAEGIATFAHDHHGMDRRAHEEVMDAALRASGAEYLALCGYMRILTADFVAGWEGRMVNTHPSLLPKFKGLDTHQRAIDAGEAFGGCSVHVVTPELDGGPLLGQVPVAILPDDTADSLARRVILAEYQLYPRMVADYVGRAYRADWLQAPGPRTGDGAARSGGAREPRFPRLALRRQERQVLRLFQRPAPRHRAYRAAGKDRRADEVEDLTETAPDTYFKPAYYGASGWVGIILNRPGVDWDNVADWLQRSWRMVAPKRLTRLHDISGPVLKRGPPAPPASAQPLAARTARLRLAGERLGQGHGQSPFARSRCALGQGPARHSRRGRARAAQRRGHGRFPAAAGSAGRIAGGGGAAQFARADDGARATGAGDPPAAATG